MYTQPLRCPISLNQTGASIATKAVPVLLQHHPLTSTALRPVFMPSLVNRFQLLLPSGFTSCHAFPLSTLTPPFVSFTQTVFTEIFLAR